METQNIIAWVLRILLAAAFLFFGISKFFNPAAAQQFVSWGYPAGWHLATGAIEVLGAVLLLIPAGTLAGVGVLVAVMTSATVTHLMHEQGSLVLLPLALLVSLVALGWLRWSYRA